MKLTGTLVNYYFHCIRQCWLHGNYINLEDNSEDVKIGKALHEKKLGESKESEVRIEHIMIDKLTKEYLIEIKKSDADVEAVKWQTLFYLKQLSQKGIDKVGKIEFLEKNKQNSKTIFVELTDEKLTELINIERKICDLILQKYPPEVILSNKCKKCSYYELCYI